jgi:hypothetical protein
MRRMTSLGLAGAMVLIVAAPAAAAKPARDVLQFTTDPYVIAECDGYDVMEQVDVNIREMDFFDKSGNFVRHVSHAASTGVEWRSDTGALLATYQDAGGTFTATANNVFTWTGIHNQWTRTDGTVIRDVGRVVVAEVAPGDFERIFEAGSIPEPDFCTW